jgi:2'-5' RNA ligase
VSDIVSIELMLDAASEAAVRADWDRLRAAGHSSVAAHTAASNRPHVTLLVRERLEPATFADAVAQLPVALSLAEPIVFRHGDRGVLARRVVGDGLRRLHEAVHGAVPPGLDAPHTAPGEWTPHVTLARRLRLVDLDDARGLLGPEREGAGVALRRWDSATREVTAVGDEAASAQSRQV